MTDEKNTAYVQVIYRRGVDGTEISYFPSKLFSQEILDKWIKYIHYSADEDGNISRNSRTFKEMIVFLEANVDLEIRRTPAFPFTLDGIIHISLESLV